MTILEPLGLKVKVLINGRDAQEYPDEEPDAAVDGFSPNTPTTHHYVESIDGADFCIQVTAKPLAAERWIDNVENGAIRFYIDVDGQNSVARGTATSDRLTHTVSGVKIYAGPVIALRNFHFAPVSTVDDASKQQVAEDAAKAQRLGTIRIRAYRATFFDRNYPTRGQHTSALDQRDGFSLAEKALKGRSLSHGSTLSPVVKNIQNPGTSRKFQRIDGDNAPLAVFYFKYRSKEALQQELIIPRPRSISEGSDVVKLPYGEVGRLTSLYPPRSRADKKRAASVKDEDGRPPPSGRPVKAIKTEGGGKTFIDLTEDD